MHTCTTKKRFYYLPLHSLIDVTGAVLSVSGVASVICDASISLTAEMTCDNDDDMVMDDSDK